MKRCEWANSDQLMRNYHDEEWGVPVHDDRRLFEYLILEGTQAGLSWSTILKKREEYRIAFYNFDAAKILRYVPGNIYNLMSNPGIIRNRMKIKAAVTNAEAFLEVQRQFGSFDAYIWHFVGGNPIINAWKKLADIPVFTQESEAMSRDMKKRGFSFVGSTICYAFMQAVGMVNDHIVECFRYKTCK
ncbi:MAG: DNA-3-methyladenine glycosylase I [Nitrospiraceae bacterium]|nr:MAG: DNA-3-methyladenine glycosylase I [Nitrospiraceae bacterium]